MLHQANARTNLSLVFALMLLTVGCKKDPEIEQKIPAQQVVSPTVSSFDASTILEWNELYLVVERYAPGYRPPVSARTSAYLGLTAYEAAVSGMEEYQSMEGVLPGLVIPDVDPFQEYYWPSVVNAAYARAMRLYFPHVDSEYAFDITELENSLGAIYESQVDESVHLASVLYGIEVADAVFMWAESDQIGSVGFQENFPTYNPPACIGCWQPTGPDFTSALLPFWGDARTFAMTPLDFEIDPPHAFSVDENSALHEEALEVYNLYPLSFENQWIAEFWGDDIFELTCTPAGRWISVTNQAVEQFGLNLEQALGLYAKMGIALNDGGVSCWKNKYVYNVARPSDYIKEYIDASWQTHLITLHNCLNPPFPAYPSGHATFGAAAAGVLEAEFGSQVSFTDNSHLGRDDFMGTPRTFTSWHDMAIENAYSRLPLGVHYQMDADAGIDLGYVASYRVLELPWKN